MELQQTWKRSGSFWGGHERHGTGWREILHTGTTQARAELQGGLSGPAEWVSPHDPYKQLSHPLLCCFSCLLVTSLSQFWAYSMMWILLHSDPNLNPPTPPCCSSSFPPPPESSFSSLFFLPYHFSLVQRSDRYVEKRYGIMYHCGICDIDYGQFMFTVFFFCALCCWHTACDLTEDLFCFWTEELKSVHLRQNTADVGVKSNT